MYASTNFQGFSQELTLDKNGACSDSDNFLLLFISCWLTHGRWDFITFISIASIYFLVSIVDTKLQQRHCVVIHYCHYRNACNVYVFFSFYRYILVYFLSQSKMFTRKAKEKPLLVTRNISKSKEYLTRSINHIQMAYLKPTIGLFTVINPNLSFPFCSN